ncbi:hypothetical protein GCM10025880_40790 [Methylorubrum aminovorans]|nr:hypothetical protein GCM10025880_40790 [Methylorubrum aminovorans]
MGRAEEEGFEFARALAVAPIADPDEAGALALLRRRAEQAGVGGFVPDIGAAVPALRPIDLGERLAEGEDAVVAGEIEGSHLVGRADGAVMGVVEQKRAEPAVLARPPEGRDEVGGVPLVGDDEVGAHGPLDRLLRPRTGLRGQFGIGRAIGV